MIPAIFAAALLATPVLPATDEPSRAAVRAYIEHCEQEWAQGAVVDNSARIATFIAPDYHGVSSRGKVVAFKDETAPHPLDGKAAGLYYVRVHFTTPSLVIAQGEEWWDDAQGHRHHLIWTDTWLYRGAKWQIVASQDSVLPEGTEPQG